MKKFLFVPVLALAAVSLSCSKDNIAGEGGENASGKKEVIVFSEPQIEIGAVSAGTKTTLENSSIKWEEVEYISLFNADGSNTWTYELTAGAGTTSATFTAQGEPQTGFTYAIYPQNSNVPSGAAIAANLATGQTYSEDGFPTLYPMGAKTEDGKTFVFENLATVLRLPLKGTGTIASITIESVGGEPLAGAATVDFSGDTPVMTAAAEGASASVTLNCAEPWPSLNESEPVYFNFILFPGSYSQGFRFTIKESNGNSTTVTTGGTAVELVAGSFKNFDSPLTIDTPQGWNIFGTIADNSYIELTGGHGTYFCSNVIASEGHNEFNIRYAEDESQIFGIGYGDVRPTNVPELTAYGLYQGQDGKLTLTPSETGYDIYFIEDNKDVIVTKTGTPAFCVIGNINGTAFDADIPMVVKNGYLVAENIEFTGNIFKIRIKGKWYYQGGGYDIGSSSVTVGESCQAWSYDGTSDITVTGTVSGQKYDIYLDMKRHDPNNTADNMTVWVMPAGEVPGEN